MVPDPLRGLTEAQREAAAHSGGALLVLGGAGTGKTRTLVARFAWLVDQGTAPERIALLTATPAMADTARARVEETIERAYEELAVATVPDLCARLLHEESLAAGIDPFAVTVSPADRLALLLERIEELPLRSHDFQGNPAALLASFIERIDRLKAELVTAEEYAAWAATLPGGDEGDPAREEALRQHEFAEVYRAHDRLLAEMGMLDAGDLVVRTHALLSEGSALGARLAARFDHVLADEFEELDLGPASVVGGLASGEGTLVAAAGPDETVQRFRAAADANVRAFLAARPAPRVVRLERSLRCRAPVLAAARAVVEPVAKLEQPPTGADGPEVAFWRCANERAQAQSVAADIETLLARGGVAPESVCVLVRSVRREGQAIAVALEERAVAHRLVGAAAFFQRAEIRDVLAWLRLLADPGDAGAVVRALARPPVELRSIDLARCIQIARRRKLDMVSALVAATESPQLPPEARDRILDFLQRHRAASAALDTTRPDLFVHRLIERLGLRRH